MGSRNADHVLVAALRISAYHLVPVSLRHGNLHPHTTHGALVDGCLWLMLDVVLETPDIPDILQDPL
ncbi:MAG: hypothetical protein CMA54_00440 [Euryarchaeota archaeon]|nr:hypothetical protein [Euryarchaeota archaeon]